MSYSVRQNASPFYTRNRNGQRVNKIVIHHAATTSFDGIGRTFKTARVSAHYGVGRNQNVDQYVPEPHAAWHAGNYNANMTSIGIENVNSTGAPNWLVDDATFNTLVELVRDIASRHGLLPLKVNSNLYPHSAFNATACPASLKARLHELANRVNGIPTVSKPKPKPVTKGKKSNAQVAQEVLAGKWGNNPQRAANLKRAGYDAGAIQAAVNKALGVGRISTTTSKSVTPTIVQQVIAGSWGNGPARKANLEKAGYNYAEIQAQVNAALGQGGRKVFGKSDSQLADEVIQGKWGNNPERSNRLRRAGHNPAAVQAIVNRKLGF